MAGQMKIEPFEKHIDRYESWFIKNRFAFESELKAIRQLLPCNGTGVEIGVGSGLFAQALGIRFGIDPSIKMQKLAKKRRVKTFAGTGEYLPLKTASIDYLLNVTTICFLDDVELAFKEAYRVLKNDGIIVIGFVDKHSAVGRKYEEHKNENVFYRIARFYSTEEVIGLLKKSGFIRFDIVQTIFRDLNELKDIEPVKPGYGQGSFIVIKTYKPLD
ncbi:MAG: class I SAM-dependent methyltransferase [Candidatus Hydrogenedentota bacterium]